MTINETEIYKNFGEIRFGEINNYCIDEFGDSLDNYLLTRVWYPDYLRQFGSLKFGEINNHYLREFENDLKDYLSIQ
ncbi:MAG: hypothetical protein GF317_15840 [Candidatus Lokiarchaeota archaeon]|nr:hypothetical protein [Candidatus Lokiarchaeota archaeon]MBD3201022.1 hypothetical protein [Candidatus Lokiarchaeota archaeon]